MELTYTAEELVAREAQRREAEVASWAARLFRWECVNCTFPQPVRSPTPAMLSFASAFLDRVEAGRAHGAAKDRAIMALATWTMLPEPRPPRPAEPDLAPLLAALPAVPPPPALPAALLAEQECDSCGAAFALHSAPASGPEGADAAAGVNWGLLALTVGECVDGVGWEDAEPEECGEEEGSGGGGGDDDALRAAVLRRGARRAVEAYLADAGVTAQGVAAALADAGCAGCAAAMCAPAAAAPPACGHAAAGAVGGRVRPQPPVVALAFDSRMLLHEQAPPPRREPSATLAGVELPREPPSQHPERPDRLRAIAQHLSAQGLLQHCLRLPVRPATRPQLATVHEGPYLDRVDGLPERVAQQGAHALDKGDTFCNEHTHAAALLAAGGVLTATEAVVKGRANRGVALVRPPGHHAEADEAMGFCLFNNVAVAAAVARKEWGVRRVLILDWDVHHGNGTENMFYLDPGVLYVSIHRFGNGFFPGTGKPERVGEGPGRGYNVNIAWSGKGAGDAEYLAAFEQLVMPIARAYAPELVLVSAGFDAARGDPLGECDVTPRGYAAMTHELLSLAGGRVVVALEGGYNLASISNSMEAVLRVLLGEAPPPALLVPRGAHASPSAAALGLGLSLEDAARYDALTGSQDDDGGGRAPPPGLTPAAVEAWTENERLDALLAEEYEGDSRVDVLRSLAPEPQALRDIARTAAALAPYWPGVRSALAACAEVGRTMKAEMKEEEEEEEEGGGGEEGEEEGGEGGEEPRFPPRAAGRGAAAGDDDVIIISDGDEEPDGAAAPTRPRGFLYSLVARGKAALAAAEPLPRVLEAATEEALELIGGGGRGDEGLEDAEEGEEDEGPEDEAGGVKGESDCGESGGDDGDSDGEEEGDDESWEATGTQEDTQEGTQEEPPRKRGKNN